MPSGGPRPGGGRPVGSKDSVPRMGSRRQQMGELSRQVTNFLKTNNACIFEGDSLELAISIYKNEDLPIGLRLHALALAIPYERPRLMASASVTRHVEGDDASFGQLFQAIEQRLLSAPEKRGEIIDLLREGDGEIRIPSGHNQSRSS
jgi:hypothetical protein